MTQILISSSVLILVLALLRQVLRGEGQLLPAICPLAASSLSAAASVSDWTQRLQRDEPEQRADAGGAELPGASVHAKRCAAAKADRACFANPRCAADHAACDAAGTPANGDNK